MASSSARDGDAGDGGGERPLRTWRLVLADYMDVCSVGYLSVCYGHPVAPIRLLWLVVTAVGLVATAVHCYKLVDAYFQYESEYGSVIVQQDDAAFPAVTVCSINPLVKSKLVCNKYLTAFSRLESELHFADAAQSPVWNSVGTFAQEAGGPPAFATNRTAFGWVQNFGRGHSDAVEACRAANGSRGPPDGTPDVPQLILPGIENLRQRQLPDLHDVKGMLGALPPQLIQAAGYTLADFIYECSFDRIDCLRKSDEYLSVMMDRRYGLCHTFNSAPARRSLGLPPVSTKHSGGDNGLRLTLNVRSADYYGVVSHDVGVKVIVHDPAVRPNPADAGFLVPPDFNSAVELSRNDVGRLKAPFAGDCTESWPPKYIDDLRKAGLTALSELEYTKGGCLEVCFQYHMIWNCNCTSDPNIAVGTGTAVCLITNDTHRACMTDVTDRFNGELLPALRCHCREKCQEIAYRIETSQSRWPSLQYQRLKMVNFLYEHSDDKVARHLFERTDSGLIEKEGTDLVRLTVFLNSKNYAVTEERVAYPLENLVADLGGVLGLYVAMSLLTLVELAHLAIAAAYCLLRCGGGGGGKADRAAGDRVHGGDDGRDQSARGAGDRRDIGGSRDMAARGWDGERAQRTAGAAPARRLARTRPLP